MIYLTGEIRSSRTAESTPGNIFSTPSLSKAASCVRCAGGSCEGADADVTDSVRALLASGGSGGVPALLGEWSDGLVWTDGEPSSCPDMSNKGNSAASSPVPKPPITRRLPTPFSLPPPQHLEVRSPCPSARSACPVPGTAVLWGPVTAQAKSCFLLRGPVLRELPRHHNYFLLWGPVTGSMSREG